MVDDLETPAEEGREPVRRRRRSIDQIRAEARAHGRQLEAVNWMTVQELAGRWGVSQGTVRAIPREQLKYLTLGKSTVRRYHPDDVSSFETNGGVQEPAQPANPGSAA
jgi:hypothetical protein